MVILAEAWYQSQLFWAIAAVAATVLVFIPSFWVAQRALPRRKLTYVMLSDTPLLTRLMHGKLEVRHEGVALKHPRVVTVQLESRGRQDIASSSFDQGKPLVLDLGVPIVDLLAAESDAKGAAPASQMNVDTTALRIGPSLIKNRHVLTYTVLVDGEPDLTCHAALENVVVRASDLLESEARLSWTSVILSTVSLLVIIVLTVLRATDVIDDDAMAWIGAGFLLPTLAVQPLIIGRRRRLTAQRRSQEP